jgi:hypothetical protein
VRTVTDAQRRARIGRRHGLAPAHRHPDLAAATAAMGVWHSTEPSSVHLAVAARTIGVTVADVEATLYGSRSLVKQLAMRRTLFAFPRPLHAAALVSASARLAERMRTTWSRTLVSQGVTSDADRWLADIACEIEALLSDGIPRTAREVGAAVPSLGARVGVGTGTRWATTVSLAPNTLHLLGAEGRIVRGPNAGPWRLSKPAWTPMSSWLGADPEPMEAREGWAQLVEAHLSAFGPATEDDTVWWLGATKGVVRAALADLCAEQVALDDGRTGWLLPGDDLSDTDDPDPWAALTPVLDPTVMGWHGRGRAHYLAAAEAPYFFDAVGNAGPTAWVDGRLVGAWVQDESGRVSVVLRGRLPASRRRLLDIEAERLTAFLDGVRIASPYAGRLARGEPLG